VKAKELPGYGAVLVTADDEPLYLLTSDPEGGTDCPAECAENWEPLLADEPSGGDGVDEGELATFEREGGGRQVLYHGHALYTYTRPGAGMGAGAGVKWEDGTWYLVNPGGEAIKTTAVGGY
jgi:predicted lipoprotein with Yx(FWY)xxD motif